MKYSFLKKLRQLNPMPDIYNPGEVLAPGTKYAITTEDNWDQMLIDWYNAYKAGYTKAVLKANPNFKLP
ncbi:MAG: hypothetical protein Unbinned1819contig1001_51 [Prokaryotic dsDNA virus sp.]|nr:MAG: hypothetical protein Unbinned1819contig1001_51 [Prokaryotic dsDNA virus sp.]|tara:strand:+ start:29376 stop:29582 length:207 start_codon:yes stop_codon:yes gene_type:complete